MPGALTSARERSLDTMAPFPSIASPRPSTTRPSNSGPTGTSTMEPVRLTVSPSRMDRSSPKITTPTLESSKLSAMPRKPEEKTTISPACTLLSPYTRAIPSPTETTLPTSSNEAADYKKNNRRFFEVEERKRRCGEDGDGGGRKGVSIYASRSKGEMLGNYRCILGRLLADACLQVVAQLDDRSRETGHGAPRTHGGNGRLFDVF